MSSREFCYWLQGFFEIHDGAPVIPGELGKFGDLTTEQTTTIRERLAMVFAHEIDPSQRNAQRQDSPAKIHQGAPCGPWGVSKQRC